LFAATQDTANPRHDIDPGNLSISGTGQASDVLLFDLA
jgi:hypothetical protein